VEEAKIFIILVFLFSYIYLVTIHAVVTAQDTITFGNSQEGYWKHSITMSLSCFVVNPSSSEIKRMKFSLAGPNQGNSLVSTHTKWHHSDTLHLGIFSKLILQESC
jgi:hypothetical protein